MNHFSRRHRCVTFAARGFAPSDVPEDVDAYSQAQAADDITVFKHRLSGFHDNELDSILRQLGITTLLFCGVNTDRCVFSTLQDAGFLGYDCVLLKDACSTPSPVYVTRAIHFLVDKLHGFVGTAEALIPALTAASSLPTNPTAKKDPR